MTAGDDNENKMIHRWCEYQYIWWIIGDVAVDVTPRIGLPLPALRASAMERATLINGDLHLCSNHRMRILTVGSAAAPRGQNIGMAVPRLPVLRALL